MSKVAALCIAFMMVTAGSICYYLVAVHAFTEPTCFWFHGTCDSYDVLFGDMYAGLTLLGLVAIVVIVAEMLFGKKASRRR